MRQPVIASRILRLALTGICLVVLSDIGPISLTHWHTGNACPLLGPIPACYLISICYAAMGIAALWWTKRLPWLFFSAVIPVIVLATIGTSLELLGHPTCPKSDAGWPLCYSSLMIGVVMLVGFTIVLALQRKDRE